MFNEAFWFCADISVRVRGDIQPAVRGAVHTTQRDGVGRHPGRAVALSNRTHQAT